MCVWCVRECVCVCGVRVCCVCVCVWCVCLWCVSVCGVRVCGVCVCGCECMCGCECVGVCVVCVCVCVCVCVKLCQGDSPLHVARSGCSTTAKPCTDRPKCDPPLGILARLVGFENSDAR